MKTKESYNHQSDEGAQTDLRSMTPWEKDQVAPKDKKNKKKEE